MLFDVPSADDAVEDQEDGGNQADCPLLLRDCVEGLAIVTFTSEANSVAVDQVDELLLLTVTVGSR